MRGWEEKPRRTSSTQGPARPVRVEQHRDAGSPDCWARARLLSGRAHAGTPPSASRTPDIAHREPGGKKLRYDARAWPGGVSAQPPRSTIWLDMNLPLYSPIAPSAGWKPGIGEVGRAGPLPAVAVRLPQPAAGGAGRGSGLRVVGRSVREVADRVALAVLLDRVLPLGLGRQPLARPGRERVGLVVADVGDRQARVDRPGAVQGVLEPDAVDLVPVERRAPALVVDPGPAVGEPQLGAAVAAVGDEPQPLAVGHQPVGEPERLEPDLVARQLVVEAEAGALVADLDQPAVDVDPAERVRARQPHSATRRTRAGAG